MNRLKTFDGALPRIRTELDIPASFSPDVLAAAEGSAQRLPLENSERSRRSNYTIVPFVTIDPEGSLDLDQAFFAQRTLSGFIVLYAIADIGYFVDRGGLIEVEAWRRGETFYSPDTQTLLYPETLSKGAASLLPGLERPCVLFTFELDERARRVSMNVEASIIVSRARLAYEHVSQHLAAERDRPSSGEYSGEEFAESLGLLETIGRLRQILEYERGGISLPIAAQHVQRWSAAIKGYTLSFKNPNDVEGWNAQISLMTGIAGARLMTDHGVGLLRTLDPPRPDKLEALRLTAGALGIDWPEELDYARFIRSLDATNPRHAAVIYHAAGVMGSARYEAFDGGVGPRSQHAAIATYYAHVTAPLRRLADRYSLDLLVELSAGSRPSREHIETLFRLPTVMNSADRKARTLESRVVDIAEAKLLADRVGETFEALVVRLRNDRVTVQITMPPVRADVPRRLFEPETQGSAGLTVAPVEGGSAFDGPADEIRLGTAVSLRLTAADPESGRVVFDPVEEH